MPEPKRNVVSLATFGASSPRPAPDGPGGAPGRSSTTVGDLLRRRREELGWSLDQVAAGLRIRRAFLEAMEANDHAALPGKAYALGFLRTYATALGLDPAVVLRRHKEESAGAGAEPELYFPEPMNVNRLPGGAAILAGLLLAVVAYGGWLAFTAADRPLADLVPALPDRLARLVEGGPPDPPPTPAPVLPPPEARALVGSAQPTGPEIGASGAPPPDVLAGPASPPALPESATPVTAAEDDSELPPMPDIGGEALPPAAGVEDGPALSLPPPAEAPPPAGRVFGQAEGPARVVVRATEDSWFEVRDAGGRQFVARLLRAGDEFRAPDLPGLTMRAGNAGGLAISVDGQAIPPVGSRGEVVRNISLDPQDLAARRAPPAAPAQR